MVLYNKIQQGVCPEHVLRGTPLPMSTKKPHSSQSASEMIRALAALDRESEEHRKIYEDLKEE